MPDELREALEWIADAEHAEAAGTFEGLHEWAVEAHERARAALAASSSPVREVAAFVFVAAERYALDRLWTGVSKDVAWQVKLHAETVRGDAGCVNAIIKDVEAWIKRGDRRGQSGVHLHEIEATERAWLDAVAALRGER